MSTSKNPGHVKQGDERPVDDVEHGDLEARNEARSEGLPEPKGRDIHQAGGGTLGKDLGGSHTGRYGAHPELTSNRERKPRGDDKDEQ